MNTFTIDNEDYKFMMKTSLNIRDKNIYKKDTSILEFINSIYPDVLSKIISDYTDTIFNYSIYHISHSTSNIIIDNVVSFVLKSEKIENIQINNNSITISLCSYNLFTPNLINFMNLYMEKTYNINYYISCTSHSSSSEYYKSLENTNKYLLHTTEDIKQYDTDTVEEYTYIPYITEGNIVLKTQDVTYTTYEINNTEDFEDTIHIIKLISHTINRIKYYIGYGY